MGIDFGLYVDKPTYESWLCLLKGLVHAKDKDSKQFRRTRGFPRTPRNMDIRSLRSLVQNQPSRHRARSTSPRSSESNFVGNIAFPILGPVNAEASPRSGLKRSAAAAFSPTSATFAHIPSKRPVSMSVVVPELVVPSNRPSSSSYSPSEPLRSFAKMSLGSSPASVKPPSDSVCVTTLSTAYAVNEQRYPVGPQVSESVFFPLYYY